MKKIILAAVACAAMGFAFAEGSAWDVNGYFRSGIEGNTEGKNVKTKTFKDGKYYGNGTSRARLNINFTQEEYGFKFRYQNEKFGWENQSATDKNNWFNSSNISYMFGYAKFCDGKIVAEAGKLMDFYTQSEARFEYQAIGDYGVRAVVVPVDGLFLSAAATTYRAETYADDDDEVVDGKATVGNIKFNEKLLTLSAKYKHEKFTVAGGYNLAGEAYGFFALKAVPNLKFNVEARYWDKDISGKLDGDKATSYTEAWELVNYNFKGMGLPLEAGVYFHQTLVKDDNVIEFYPHLSYAINDVVSPEFEVGIIQYSNGDKHKDKDGEKQTMSFNVTPSVKFTAGKRATVKVYYNYDKNDKSSFGTTLRVNY